MTPFPGGYLSQDEVDARMTTHPTDLDTLLKEERAKNERLERHRDMLKQLLDDANAHHFDATMRAEAAEASALTARRDGERDGLLKAADLIDARERDAHAEAALRAQDGDRAGDMHWCAKSLALNQAAKTLRALASTVPGGEEPS